MKRSPDRVDGKFLRHLVQTPTLASTTVGCLGLLGMMLGIKYADLAAFGGFTVAGCGTAITLHVEVTRDGQVWGWRGLFNALRHPSKWFLAGLFGHLPQLIIAIIIALAWRARTRKD